MHKEHIYHSDIGLYHYIDYHNVINTLCQKSYFSLQKDINGHECIMYSEQLLHTTFYLQLVYI